MNSKKQIALLSAVIYFIQGALGISAIALPIYFRRLGWSISEIAMISSVSSLPWIFKIIYGFLSDSFPIAGYRRKSYLFIFLGCSIAGWIALAFYGTTQRSVMLALWVANLGFAGTDVITDGLIVENSEGKWARIYQSLAWGFRSLGSILTGILGGWLTLQIEPKVIFLMTAGLPFLALFPLFSFHEVRFQPREGAGFLSGREQFKRVSRFCLTQQAFFFIFFLCLSTSSVLFGTPFFFHMKEKLLMKEDYLGLLISLGWVGAAAGSILFAVALKRVSMQKLFHAVIILNAVNILSTYAVQGPVSAAILIFLGGMAGGIMILPLMTAAAEMASQSGVEGTLFALMMGIFNLSQIFWGMLGSKLLGPLGLNGLIALATLVQLAGYLVISPLSKISFSTGAVSQPGKVE